MTGITIKEAATRCGWSSDTPFRKRFLKDEADRERLGYHIDVRGRALLDPEKVEACVREALEERRARGNWRARNLGVHAQCRAIPTPADRPTRSSKASKERRTPGRRKQVEPRGDRQG